MVSKGYDLDKEKTAFRNFLLTKFRITKEEEISPEIATKIIEIIKSRIPLQR